MFQNKNTRKVIVVVIALSMICLFSCEKSSVETTSKKTSTESGMGYTLPPPLRAVDVALSYAPLAERPLIKRKSYVDVVTDAGKLIAIQVIAVKNDYAVLMVNVKQAELIVGSLDKGNLTMTISKQPASSFRPSLTPKSNDKKT